MSQILKTQQQKPDDEITVAQNIMSPDIVTSSDINRSSANVTIVFKLYAMLARYLPPEAENNQVEMSIKAQTSVADIIERYGLPEALTHLVLVNGHYVAPADRDKRWLSEGDHLAIWPPIAGG